jgi:hypothetical protein
MKKSDKKSNPFKTVKNKEAETEFLGYPLYPASEDVYSKFKEEEDIDPENTSKLKQPVELDFEGEAGGDLDIPGSELDDEQENIGSEDEENNYYSLGGDDHNDLEEDKGE